MHPEQQAPPSGNLLVWALGARTVSPASLDADAVEVASGVSLERVELTAQQVVHRAGEPVHAVHFPVDAVLGLLTQLPDAPPAQVMAVGREGVVGLAAAMGDGTSPYDVVSQVPGRAWRLPLPTLLRWADDNVRVRRLLGRYDQTTTVLLAQRVACGQRHTAEQRCATWLLQCADRVGAETFPLTQAALGVMLGVQRTTASATAGQRHGRRRRRCRAGA